MFKYASYYCQGKGIMYFMYSVVLRLEVNNVYN